MIRQGQVAPNPVDTDDILTALDRFVEREVVPREQEHAATLEDPRQRYEASGAYSPIVRQLIREVRRASATAGYYTMFAPEDVGGGGLGAVLFFRAWAHLYELCGPGRPLVY